MKPEKGAPPAMASNPNGRPSKGAWHWPSRQLLWPLRLAPKFGMKRFLSPSQPQLELAASALRCTEPAKPPT
ncbi:hypothetical protein D3C85_1774430 [compost metagenome]